MGEIGGEVNMNEIVKELIKNKKTTLKINIRFDYFLLVGNWNN